MLSTEPGEFHVELGAASSQRATELTERIHVIDRNGSDECAMSGSTSAGNEHSSAGDRRCDLRE